MTPEERTPRRTVAGLFFATYLSPFVLWIGWGLLSGGGRSISHFNLILTAWIILLFPSGLFGFVTDSKDLRRLAAFGYIVYAVLFILAFSLRRRWQTAVLWAILLILLVFNAVGCQIVADNATRGMTLP